jgi:hypothetical protein
MDDYDYINESHYDTETLIALTRKDIRYIRKNMCDIKMALEKQYVTKLEFNPVRRLVYGSIGIGGTALITWLVYAFVSSIQVIK